MKKSEIKILKLLGYQDAEDAGEVPFEDEAILKHKMFGYYAGKYADNINLVFAHSNFEEIMEGYTMWVAESAQRHAMTCVQNNIWNMKCQWETK
jgi:hypothetical protein